MVQNKMAARGPRMSHPRTNHSPYLLSGFTFCQCGRAMTGRSAKSGRHFYYMCSRAAKQGTAACGAKMLSKNRFEGLVIEQLRARVLTDENMSKLVKLVNEELNVELRDITIRLDRHYEAIETRQLDIEDLAPRIKEIRVRQEHLNEVKTRLESEWSKQSPGFVDDELVQGYAGDLQSLLEESEVTERKAFVRSFVDRIEVNPEDVTIHYRLPLPSDPSKADSVEVLPIETFGGPNWTVGSTIFEMWLGGL